MDDILSLTRQSVSPVILKKRETIVRTSKRVFANLISQGNIIAFLAGYRPESMHFSQSPVYTYMRKHLNKAPHTSPERNNMARPQSDPSLPTQTQAQPEESARPRPPRPESPYSNVDVLLLQWESDDLKVDREIKELEHVFATMCHFTTHRWSIPSIDPEDGLANRIFEFKRGKTVDDLLILYYGGHAGGDPQECFWAANSHKGSPELNWYNVQNILLGSPADVLLILDCCFAALAARNSGTGANWFLGASAKESVTTGVSRNSFTSALTREIDRWADQYWTKNVTFTVQSIHQGLTFWDRDLVHSPILLRLTDHESHPTELTPLLYPRGQTQVPKTSTEPVGQNAHPSSSPPLPYIPNGHTRPMHNGADRVSERDSSSLLDHRPTVAQLSPGETQTLRVQGLPLSTDTRDLVHWFENRLGRASVITKIGPLTESPAKRGSKETTVTFSSIALAMQALTIRDLDFQAKAGDYPRNITIDKDFTGLTCLYSSIRSPNRQPTIDIVLVHGAFGHALNSFASHYTEPPSECIWPCEALARPLEEAGVYPRIMTFGWDADAWLDLHRGTPHSCDDLIGALKERTTGKQLPLFFIGHGVGGFLVKEAVNETINNGFSFQHFENPVKACFFFAVPNRPEGIDDGFPRLLANMCSVLQHGVRPDATVVRAFRSRKNAVSSLTQEFEEIRQEHGVKCLTFNGSRRTSGCMIVPSEQSTLDDKEDSAFHFDLDYRDVMRLPMNGEHLKRVVDTLVDAICHKLGVSHLSNGQTPPAAALDSLQLDGNQPSFVSRPKGKPKQKEKERVFGNLRSYDTVFLVDDSDSMYGPRWDTTKHVLAKIASIAVLHDRDGVDIRFFNYYLEDDERLNLDSAEKVMNIFDQVDPFGSTRTADVLERELNDYMFEYRKNRRRKGLNLIVLTDGEPDDGQDVAGGIAKFAKKLEVSEAPLRQVGIQFVQIGGDKKAAEFLGTLDNDLQKNFSLDRDVSAHGGTSSS